MAGINSTSTWWCVVAYNKDIEILEAPPPYPFYVRKIYGGREKCPDTGNIHFQGAIQCWSAVRGTQFKSWLPTANLQKARCKEALAKYAMKAETAIGPKIIQENSLPHFPANVICEKIAMAIVSDKGQTDRQTDSFWRGVKSILQDSPELAGQLMNPSLRNFFKNTESVWINRAIVLQHDDLAGSAVEVSAPQGEPPCECDKDECEDCWNKNYAVSITCPLSPVVSPAAASTDSPEESIAQSDVDSSPYATSIKQDF